MIIASLQKVILDKNTLFVTLICRICNLVLVQSWFCPDEYWQSLEVAHQKIFGYGYLTWEWKNGIRNYLFVTWIAFIFQLLKLLQLDSVFLLVWIPRLSQAIFSAYADFCFIHWVKRETHIKQAAYALYCYCFCWFIAFCSTRTLINTVELNLCSIGLYYYPFNKRRISERKFLYFVCLACIMRPTAAIFWFPLCIFHILESKNKLRLILSSYLPVGLSVLVLSTLIDSYFHGSLIFTAFKFLWFNVYKNVSVHYSVEPFHWYFTNGLPVVLGPFLIPFLRGPSKMNIVNKKLTYAFAFTILIYSFIPHKEFRFLLPLAPAMMFIVSDRMHIWFARFKNRNHGDIILLILAVINLGLLIFFGMFHQIGTITIMGKIPSQNGTKVLFLMPCHSTPLYSHIHANISTRFLTCEPNLQETPDYSDEAAVFYQDPLKWLENEFQHEPENHLPTHLVAFESLTDPIMPFLKGHKYRLSDRIFHTYFTSDSRVSSHVCLFEKYS